MFVLKYGLSMFLGVIVTTSLLYVMQSLIQSGNSVLKAEKQEVLVDFVRLQEIRQLNLKTRKPEPPSEPDEPPPTMPKEVFEVTVDDAAWSVDQTVSLNTEFEMAGGDFVADGDYLPIVKVQPAYPRRALARELIGWVMLKFNVNENGMVESPSIIENCAMLSTFQEGEVDTCVDQPSTIFDEAAIKAALRFKYRPKVINGTPVATVGVVNRITFTIER